MANKGLISVAVIALSIFMIVAALVVSRVVQHVQWMQRGKVVYNHQPGPCHHIKGIEYGSEDLQVLPNGMMFISAGLKLAVDPSLVTSEDVENQKGIMLYDMSNPEKGVVPLVIEGDIDLKLFTPVGISLWQEGDNITLFVINRPGVELVEVFTFDINTPTKLKHEETITTELFWDINDLVAVGPRQFYVTNSMKHKGSMVQVELWLRLHLGTVVYYDGQNSRVVVDGYLFANGINKSPDGKYIYVGSMGDNEITVYERQSDNSLESKQVLKVGAVDNIDVDPLTGDLWVAFHPVPHKILDHLDDLSLHPPSQAVHLHARDGLITDMYEVFSDDGSKFIAGSSVATHANNKLIVGSLFHKALVCDILYPQ